MKKSAALLFLLLFVPLARAQYFPMTNAVNWLVNSASYGTSPYVQWERYFGAYWVNMNPQFTNSIFDVGQSGSASQNDYQVNWIKWVLPHASRFAIPFNGMSMANDNGSYHSNDVYTWMSPMILSPPHFWTGTADSNYSGVVTFPSVSFYANGGIPTGSDMSIVQSREDGATNVSLAAGTPAIRLYTWLTSNHAFTNLTYAGVNHDHPSSAQALEMAIGTLLFLNVETNVGSLTFDWNGVKCYSNHWGVAGLSVSGNTLTATARPTRMPMGFDVPDGYITNDCRPAFTNFPALGMSFRWMLQVTNLPSGTFQVAFNGSNIVQLTDGQLAAGWNMFTNYSGVFWNALSQVQTNICNENGVDPVTLLETHNAGSAGVWGVGDIINYRSNGTGFNNPTNITTFLSQMQTALNGMDTNAYHTFLSAQPPTATLTITQISTNSPAPVILLPFRIACILPPLPDWEPKMHFVPPDFSQEKTEVTEKTQNAHPLLTPLPPVNTKKITLIWEASPDPSVGSYEILATDDLPPRFSVITNTALTSITLPAAKAHQFFTALSVDTNGLNSLGNYQ